MSTSAASAIPARSYGPRWCSISGTRGTSSRRDDRKERCMRRGWGYLGAAIIGATVAAGVGIPGCVFYLNPQCDDRIRNGDETDIDCGGACGKCDIGASCSKDTDC